MPQRRAAYPSALKTGAAHLAFSTGVFAGLTLSVAGILNLLGDPDDAGPVVQLALFEPVNDAGPPHLKDRLADPTIPELQLAAMQPVAERPVLDEPSLGVEYAPAKVATARSRPAGQPAAPTVAEGGAAEPVGVRINGRTVLPGEAFSTVLALESLPAAPIAALQQATPQGKVPAIAADGRAPADAYARPFSNSDGGPTVSVVLGGLGLNYTHTKTAIAELPPEVTLSFSPHTRGLDTWIDRARKAGHEVLIEVPMEAEAYGRMAPHPLTLKADANPGTIDQQLDRVLASASGYFGIMNFQGDRFARKPDLARAVVEHLDARGLAFIEDGNLTGTPFAGPARATGSRYASADEVIDVRLEADAMRDRLMALESEARSSGAALGTAIAYPVTIDALRDWAEGLAGRGITLAPASHVARTRQADAGSGSVPGSVSGSGSGAAIAPSLLDEDASAVAWEVVEPQPFEPPRRTGG